MDINKAYRLISEKLGVWLREFIRLLPNLLLAALILAIGLMVSKWVKRLAQKAIHRFGHHGSLADLFSSFIYIVCIGITLFITLSVLQLDKAVTSILAGAGIIGLALAFAFQDIAANFISGIFLAVRKPLQVGEIVKIKDYMGEVESINLRDTVVRTFQGQLVIIPNKDVFQNPIENYTHLGKRRIDLTIGVSYGDDLEKVRQVALDAVSDMKGLATDEKTTLFFESFGDSAINFSLRIWVSVPEQPGYLEVRSEAIIRIMKAFNEAGISIPFPIRTLDFGIKGGEKLSDMPINLNTKESGAQQL